MCAVLRGLVWIIQWKSNATVLVFPSPIPRELRISTHEFSGTPNFRVTHLRNIHEFSLFRTMTL